MSSLALAAGTCGFTTTTLGTIATSDTGVKLFTGSYGRSL